MERITYTSGAKWEDIVGYSRAVQIGNHIEVAGTVATDANGIVAKGDLYWTDKIHHTKDLRRFTESWLFLKGRCENPDVCYRYIALGRGGKAHGEFFKDIKPVTSMIEVKGLIDPGT